MRAADDITFKDGRFARKVPLGLCIYRPAARAKMWARGVRGIISEVLLERWGEIAGTWVQTHRKTGLRRAMQCSYLIAPRPSLQCVCVCGRERGSCA